MVEPQSQLPVLPLQQTPFECERNALWLAYLKWADSAKRHRDEPGRVLAHHLRPASASFGVAVVLELEQHHQIQVHDRVKSGDVVGVWIAVVAASLPDVSPANSPATVACRHKCGAVCPDVSQDAVQILNATTGKRFNHLRMLAQHEIALVPLVQGDVRLLTWQVPPGCHRAVGQRHIFLKYPATT